MQNKMNTQTRLLQDIEKRVSAILKPALERCQNIADNVPVRQTNGLSDSLDVLDRSIEAGTDLLSWNLENIHNDLKQELAG